MMDRDNHVRASILPDAFQLQTPALRRCRPRHVPIMCRGCDVSQVMRRKMRAVGFSSRTFLLAPDDTLWRLATSKFHRMLRDPISQRLLPFAGQRVRMANVVVELVASEPVRVIRTTYAVLAFDAEGRLDPGRFEKQQLASWSRSSPRASLRPMRATSVSSTPRPDSSRKGGDGFRRPAWRA
ncbi:MAG TPA: hypothetical protein VJU59_17675 [Paraburkholderia sp.]|uniref:hypothetical protein n=1 Tax=Paraburkholderia sp. TaxID=1926495 RepID=UPI002B45EF7F|nr:hypothetical protein [Paraburkholderia sp.]HKR41477.1 hypothetical protein [Paraburkholderia sp.]